jgi:hypothetical protein
MTWLAAVRPDDWNYVLLLHIGGAMILVGGMLTAAAALVFARGEVALLRLGYWSLLLVCLPGYILMRIGAEWLYSKEGYGDLPEDASHPLWINIGYVTADAGLLLLVIALVIGGIGVRRLGGGRGERLLKATMVLSLILLAAFVVTIWAMAAKPA